MAAGAAITYYGRKPQIVVVASEPQIVYVNSVAMVTPATDLAAQTTTFRLLFTEWGVVEYLEAESVFGYQYLLFFCDKEGRAVRIIPQDRIRNVVRFAVGEKWSDHP